MTSERTLCQLDKLFVERTVSPPVLVTRRNSRRNLSVEDKCSMT